MWKVYFEEEFVIYFYIVICVCIVFNVMDVKFNFDNVFNGEVVWIDML